MNLQTKRINGSAFTSNDILEVVFTNSSDDVVVSAIHSIEAVSGPNVTHGGGGLPGEYLHYKDINRDGVDGVIDYSKISMPVAQASKGISVIKVVISFLSVSKSDEFDTDYQEWFNRPMAEKTTTLVTRPTIEDYYQELKTGSIQLDWSDDALI